MTTYEIELLEQIYADLETLMNVFKKQYHEHPLVGHYENLLRINEQPSKHQRENERDALESIHCTIGNLTNAELTYLVLGDVEVWDVHYAIENFLYQNM